MAWADGANEGVLVRLVGPERPDCSEQRQGTPYAHLLPPLAHLPPKGAFRLTAQERGEGSRTRASTASGHTHTFGRTHSPSAPGRRQSRAHPPSKVGLSRVGFGGAYGADHRLRSAAAVGPFFPLRFPLLLSAPSSAPARGPLSSSSSSASGGRPSEAESLAGSRRRSRTCLPRSAASPAARRLDAARSGSVAGAGRSNAVTQRHC